MSGSTSTKTALLHFNSSTNPLLDSSGKSTFSATGTVVRGADYFGKAGGGSFPGLIDEVRVTKGVARYNGNFTVPSSAYPNQ